MPIIACDQIQYQSESVQIAESAGIITTCSMITKYRVFFSVLVLLKILE